VSCGQLQRKRETADEAADLGDHHRILGQLGGQIVHPVEEERRCCFGRKGTKSQLPLAEDAKPLPAGDQRVELTSTTEHVTELPVAESTRSNPSRTTRVGRPATPAATDDGAVPRAAATMSTSRAGSDPRTRRTKRTRPSYA